MNILITTALPRSGTTLLSNVLNNSEQAMTAHGPNIEIYRYHRGELIKKFGSNQLKKKINYFSPIQDYFGADYKIELLNLMLNSDLNLKFPNKLWKKFLDQSSNRIDHDSADLIKNFKLLKSNTFRGILKNLFKIIKITRKVKRRKLIGINESWNICSYPAIAKSFPKAKFIILIRDPRAIYAALEKNASKRKELKVQILSVIRHFRKYVILSNFFLKLKIFDKKILILRFEDLINKPKKQIKMMCKFLNIRYVKSMIDVKNFIDHAKNDKYTGSSAFELKFKSFDKRPIKNWEKYLTPIDVKTIEFLCSKELKSAGYKLKYKLNKKDLKQISNNLRNDYKKKVNWKTDNNNFNLDLKYEIKRENELKNRNQNFNKKNFLNLSNNLKNISDYFKKII